MDPPPGRLRTSSGGQTGTDALGNSRGYPCYPCYPWSKQGPPRSKGVIDEALDPRIREDDECAGWGSRLRRERVVAKSVARAVLHGQEGRATHKRIGDRDSEHTLSQTCCNTLRRDLEPIPVGGPVRGAPGHRGGGAERLDGLRAPAVPRKLALLRRIVRTTYLMRLTELMAHLVNHYLKLTPEEEVEMSPALLEALDQLAL